MPQDPDELIPKPLVPIDPDDGVGGPPAEAIRGAGCAHTNRPRGPGSRPDSSTSARGSPCPWVATRSLRNDGRQRDPDRAGAAEPAG